MDDRRPSPEALLKEAGSSGRGRLMIFLGAAPGVGKTFEMLSAAHARQREGIDVVVGVVETHGRQETEALTEGLEIPTWFTFPEVAAELRRTHPPRKAQGFTVFMTGLSGSGK